MPYSPSTKALTNNKSLTLGPLGYFYHHSHQNGGVVLTPHPVSILLITD